MGRLSTTECTYLPTYPHPQLRWLYGGGIPGLNRPHRYLVQHVGAFLVLHGAG